MLLLWGIPFALKQKKYPDKVKVVINKERKKSKVLFISSWYPNRNNPSHGIFIKRHAEAVGLFHSIAVIHACPDANIIKGNFEIEESERNNVLSVVVYYKKVDFYFPPVSHLLKFYRYVKAHFIAYNRVLGKMNKPDLLHLNVIYKSGLIALLFNQIYHIPFIISEHWSGYMPEDNSYKGLFRIFITKLAVRKSKRIVVISEKMKECMLKHKLFNHYITVPNAVDTQIFKPLNRVIKKNEKTRIIHVSSLNDREKNISGILRAIKKLASARNDFEIDFVGDSDEKVKFEKMALEMGILNTFVFFKGWKNPIETSEHIQRSDFFLLFSNYEGMPCVLIEAMASGIPVIATQTGGVPEIITQEQGILVPVNDEGLLLQAIEIMIDTHKNYSSENLRKYALANFSYAETGKKIAEIYHSVI